MADYQIFTNDVIQVNLWMEQFGQTLLNTHHYRLASSTTIADGPAALSALLTAIKSDTDGLYLGMKPLVSETLSFVRMTAQRIYQARYRAQTTTLGTVGEVDAEVNPPLPQNTAISVARWPARAVRGSTGRVQIPGVVFGDVSAGKLTETAMTAWGTYAFSLTYGYTTGTADQWKPCLYHAAGAGSLSYDVIGANVQQNVRTMRRRTVGRGI